MDHNFSSLSGYFTIIFGRKSTSTVSEANLQSTIKLCINLQLYKASGLQSTNLIGLKSDHNLQVFGQP